MPRLHRASVIMIHAQKETAPRVPARARVCVCLYIHLLLFCLLICIHLHVLTLISIPPPKRAHTQQRQGNPISRIDMACLEGQSSDARLGELSPVAPVWVSVYVCSCWEGPERSTRCPSSASSLTILSLPFPSSPFFFFSFSFLLSFLPATISWYDGNYGYVDADCPVLAICYTSGRMQLMRSESDSKPVLIDALMEVVAAK